MHWAPGQQRELTEHARSHGKKHCLCIIMTACMQSGVRPCSLCVCTFSNECSANAKSDILPMTCCSLHSVVFLYVGCLSLWMVMALWRLLNLFYRGYTCIISSSACTSQCLAVEQEEVTHVCMFQPILTPGTEAFFCAAALHYRSLKSFWLTAMYRERASVIQL